MGQVEDPLAGLRALEERARADAHLARLARGSSAVRARAALLAGSRTARKALADRWEPLLGLGRDR